MSSYFNYFTQLTSRANGVVISAQQGLHDNLDFFLQIFKEEFGMVRGHFGPINTVAFHPDGHGFVTGRLGLRILMLLFVSDFDSSVAK